ncbi:MAG: hypothetical protein LQ351_002608 [Letrouitia transgressa]|nr:MAG: hypothetical protein LQ351_002608 [Letrouitia transgressa]
MAPPLRMMPSLGVRPLNASQPSSSRSTLGGKGITVGKVGSGGKKMGKSGLKRHRRLARRGGVKRVSGEIYDEIRKAMTGRLRIVRNAVVYFLSTAVIELGSTLMFYFSNSSDPQGLYRLLRTCQQKE